MSVRQRIWKNSKDEPKEAWVVDYTDQAGKRRLKTFKKKKEADAYHARAPRKRRCSFQSCGRFLLSRSSRIGVSSMGCRPDLPGITMCNIRRDPGEKYCSMYPYLWTVSPFQNLVKSHLALIKKFPNRSPEISEEAALTPAD
jgi:hypothetical protein